MCEAYAGLYLICSWNSKLASEAGVESTRQTIVRGRPERGVRGRKHVPSRGVLHVWGCQPHKVHVHGFPQSCTAVDLGFVLLLCTWAFCSLRRQEPLESFEWRSKVI